MYFAGDKAINTKHKKSGIKSNYPDKVVLEFEIEWNHYLLGEFDTDTFAHYFNKLKTV